MYLGRFMCARVCLFITPAARVAITQQVFFYRARDDEMMIFNPIRT